MGHNRLSQTGLGSIYNTFISQYFISQAYHWPCTFYFCIEPVWVSYNQSQGPSVPSVHSSFHKYYHNRISGHKYQPGIKWRSHLDYNACIVHNDYLNTSPMDYWSNWFTAAVCRGFKQEGIEHAPLNLGS